MRYRILGLLMMLCSFTAAAAVSVSIGINLPAYPVLQRVPGYPVYYAPRVDSNYFFYDGLYWIYDNDNWYASSWYNGPWGLVDRFDVPVYLLRVPVRYYRSAPAYFHGWRHDAPPRWGDHWGASWQQRRSGWDRWNRSSAPAPAPLPVYQRQYSGDRYPDAREQAAIQTRSYRYQPREAVVRQQYERIRAEAPAAQPRAQAQPQAQPQPRAQPSRAEQQRMQQEQQQRVEKQQQQRAQKEQQAVRKEQQRAEKQQAQPQPAPAARAQTQRTERAKEVPPGQVQRAERGKEIPPGQVQRAERPQPQGQAKGRDKDDRDDKENRGKGRDR